MKLNEGMEIFMLNGVTMKINIDEYILNALKEDITSEDVTTNAIMPEEKAGKTAVGNRRDSGVSRGGQKGFGVGV